MAARASMGLLALLLAGCETLATGPKVEPEEPLVTMPVVRRGQSGGVFSPEHSSTLTADSRAIRAGDVLTVVLQETTQANRRSGTTQGKNSSAAIASPVLLNQTIKSQIGTDAQRSFDASNTATQQNTLQGAITVVVHEVLPNGLLHIRGEKSLTLNNGEEFVRVSGYARVADIDTDNRLSSQRIANSRITYSGRGALGDTQQPGWLTRFFNSPLMPF